MSELTDPPFDTREQPCPMPRHDGHFPEPPYPTEHEAETLRATAIELREALQMLVDVQNGPTLITWKTAWDSAMNQAKAALRRSEWIV
jgi:hypothetical protein